MVAARGANTGAAVATTTAASATTAAAPATACAYVALANNDISKRKKKKDEKTGKIEREMT